MPEQQQAPTLADLIPPGGAGGPIGIPNPAPSLPPVIPTPPVPPTDPVPPNQDPNNPTPPVNPDAPTPPPDPNNPEPPADASTDDDTELTPEEFLGQVGAARGIEGYDKIDYGDVDPLSVEGFRIREELLEARAVKEFDDGLRAKDPRAYAYFLHRENGGSDEEFFQVKSFVLPTLESIEESVDLQRTVYAEALKAKGNSDKQVQVLLKAAVDGGELKDEAKAAWTEINARDKELANSTARQHETNTKRQKADMENFSSMIGQVIKEGKDFNFTVPEADKARFEASFKQNLYYDNGDFYIMKVITRDNLPKLMETELFGFVEGKLGSMIEKQATSLSARRFINKAKAANDKPGSQQQQSTSKTLGEL